jgi:cytochrome P450
MLPTRIADVDAAIVQLREYCGDLIAERRRAPRDDLVTRLAQAADQIGGLDEDYVRGTLAGLVFAGHETTKNQLGWMVAVLSDVPAEWDRVCAEPERARDVIEEVLRFRSAATSVSRITDAPIELFGVPIAAGTQLLGSLWSANRDGAAFARPDAFDVEANRAGVQIAFGQGAHHCLGAALARAELQEALVALSARLHCPRLLPGATYLPALGITGPMTLPIAFESRAASGGNGEA